MRVPVSEHWVKRVSAGAGKLLTCVGCDTAVHRACYAVIDDEDCDFRCDVCQDNNGEYKQCSQSVMPA